MKDRSVARDAVHRRYGLTVHASNVVFDLKASGAASSVGPFDTGTTITGAEPARRR